MHHRRSQGDTKSTSSLTGSVSTMPTSTNSSTSSRVSIYSMRERVILNKMTRMMGKLAPDTETEVTSRLHQEIPAIRLDGHLTYSFYLTLQNLIHLNVTYILLYHGIFWFDWSKSYHELVHSSHFLEQTSDEKTFFLRISADYSPVLNRSIQTHLINPSIYLSLIGISSIELIIVFLSTLRRKLPSLLPRHDQFQIYFNQFLFGMIFFIYIVFILWLLFQTCFQQEFPLILTGMILVHLCILTILDKPNLFRRTIDSRPSMIPSSQKTRRNSTSSSSTSSSLAASRRSNRSSNSNQTRKRNVIVEPSPVITSWSRWSSIMEEKLDVHECSTIYAQARQEADEFYPKILRRILLIFYRTLSSFILFDYLPMHINSKSHSSHNLHSISLLDSPNSINDNRPRKLLIFIFALSTFLTHCTFLFPVKLHTTLHRIVTHLGRWRRESNLRTESINPWSSECNSYTRGSVVKFTSTNVSYIAIQHMNNAAHPQSFSHSFLFRLFGDATYLLTIQFLLAFVLIICHFIWTIRGQHWQEILIGCLMIFYSSYPMFKIVRDRVILDLVDENEFIQTYTTRKIT